MIHRAVNQARVPAESSDSSSSESSDSSDSSNSSHTPVIEFVDNDGNSLTGEDYHVVTLITESDGELSSHLAEFFAFRVSLPDSTGESATLTVGSEDENGEMIAEISVTLTRESSEDPLRSQPILWQVTPQSVPNYESLAGVVGGTVYATTSQ